MKQALCTGEKGMSKESKKALHYKSVTNKINKNKKKGIGGNTLTHSIQCHSVQYKFVFVMKWRSATPATHALILACHTVCVCVVCVCIPTHMLLRGIHFILCEKIAEIREQVETCIHRNLWYSCIEIWRYKRENHFVF